MDDFDGILALYSHPSWRVSWDALEAAARFRLKGTGQVPESVWRGQPFHGWPRLRLWNDTDGMAYEVEPTTLTHRSADDLVRILTDLKANELL